MGPEGADMLDQIARIRAEMAALPSREELTTLINAELDMLGLDGRDRLYARLREQQAAAPVQPWMLGIDIDPEFGPA